MFVPSAVNQVGGGIGLTYKKRVTIMSIKYIAADLAIAPTRPKGIKVLVDTWKEMKKLGLIEMKGVAAWVSLTWVMKCPSMIGIYA